MSETRAKVAASVKERAAKLQTTITEQAGDIDAQFATYNQYSTLFQGIGEGLDFAGATEEDIQPVTAILNLIDRQLGVLQADADLQAALA